MCRFGPSGNFTSADSPACFLVVAALLLLWRLVFSHSARVLANWSRSSCGQHGSRETALPAQEGTCEGVETTSAHFAPPELRAAGICRPGSHRILFINEYLVVERRPE